MEEVEGKSKRRTVLKGLGTAAIGFSALGSATDSVRASSGPDCDIAREEQLTNKTKAPYDTKAEHGTGVTVCQANAIYDYWEIPCELSLNTATHTDGDTSSDEWAIYGSTVNLTFPDNKVRSGTTENWIGATKYTDDDDNTDDYESYALSTIEYGLGFLPAYGWMLAGSALATKMFLNYVDSTDGTQSIERYWDWYNLGEYTRPYPQVSTWVRFVGTEMSSGESISVNIHDKSSINRDTYSTAFLIEGQNTLYLTAPEMTPSTIKSMSTYEQNQLGYNTVPAGKVKRRPWQFNIAPERLRGVPDDREIVFGPPEVRVESKE